MLEQCLGKSHHTTAAKRPPKSCQENKKREDIYEGSREGQILLRGFLRASSRLRVCLSLIAA
jgi:hypothetical protein